MGDTVGFIRKLPTQLIDSFKSTLDEVREADLLLHIVDISHKNFKDHIESVNKTLLEIKAIDKPIIMIFNKIDLYDNSFDEISESSKNEKIYISKNLKKTWMAKLNQNVIFISAKKI